MSVIERPPTKPRARWRPVRDRPLSAGQVLIVGAIALVLASLLNASSLAAIADRQPYGWKRTTARLFTEPLRSLSETTGLSRPHELIDDLQGEREKGSLVPTQLPVDASPTGPASAETTAAPQPMESRRKVWFGGDSMANDIGTALSRLLDPSAMSTTIDAHVASGLVRPDYFDWPAELARVVRTKKPDVMVFMIGGNDGQTMLIDGQIRRWDEPEWQALYRSRVANIMDFLIQGGRPLVWVGQPNARSESLSAKMAIVNDIVRTEASKRKSVTYIDTWKMFAASDGGYSAYLRSDDGEQVLMRQNDGFHLNLAGANRLAKAVAAELDR